MGKEKLWTKDFITLCLMNLCFTMIFFQLMVMMSLLAVETMGASESQAGLVTGIFIIGALFGRLITGKFSAKVQLRKLLYIGTFIYILTTGLYFFADNLFALLVIRLLQGINFGFIATCTATMIAHIIPSSRRGEGIGYFGSFMIVGTAIGPFIGMYLNNAMGYISIYVFCFILSILPFVMSFFLTTAPLEPSLKPSRNTDTGQKRSIRFSDFIEMRALPIAFVTCLVAVAYSSVISFISFYAKEINLLEASGLFFLVYATAVLFSRPFTGKLIDKMGENTVVYPALLLFAGGLFFLSQVQHGWTLLLAAVVIGLGYGNYFSSAQTISIKVTPPDRFGKATTTYFLFLDAGLGVGPYLVGTLIPMLGYRNVYLTMAIVILAALVIYYFIHGRNQGRAKLRLVKQTG